MGISHARGTEQSGSGVHAPSRRIFAGWRENAGRTGEKAEQAHAPDVRNDSRFRAGGLHPVWGDGLRKGHTGGRYGDCRKHGGTKKDDGTGTAGNIDASDNTETAGNTGATDNTGTADSMPEYPLADGTVHILVYNDSFDEKHFQQSGLGEYNLLLAEETLAESYFAEGGSYTLPSYDKSQEEYGYEFLGWAAYYKKKKADGGPKLVLLPDTLTEENLLCFAPADGVREVEIHAAWRTAESGDGTQTGSNMTNTLILQAQGGLIEGEESITYNAATPLASAGAVYLCAYPVPVREGYTFTGWFETPEAGEKDGTGTEAFQSVERLNATAFYEKDEGAAEPDWSARNP